MWGAEFHENILEEPAYVLQLGEQRQNIEMNTLKYL
jgi:hypothetical protein